jgi:hypothetical protein
MEQRTGGCQCGQARYRVSGEPLRVAVCHCLECQRETGSAFSMGMFMKRDQFRLEQGALKTFERTSERGRVVRAHFCPDCGTRIYVEPPFAPALVSLRPGTLDDPSQLRPALHAWTRSRQGWLVLPPDDAQHETQPV